LEYPERIYNLPTSAISCHFSIQSPNLLAVGGHNGVIYIFNVSSKSDEVAVDTTDAPGKHYGPVWQLKWIERERSNDERAEVLISCSSDGRVVQWALRKGFQDWVEKIQKLKQKNTILQYFLFQRRH